MTADFYQTSILPYAAIIIKICRAYTDTQSDYEDYYQEVCLQIWRSRESFKQESEWSTWVYRISLNVCLTLLKKKKKTPAISDEVPIDISEEVNNYTEQNLEQLYVAIRKLSQVDKAVILLYLEEKCYDEIAAITGTNANNIGVRINRIKSRLKKLLHGKIN
ncbi:RNA polymerase sigma factor [Reichenbachiella versicolor]|uniref:RNA polymerase sigma factor n=1 Tax=Reichenbachiella versicolor TaxID=1821036 RepID=UPI000D6E1020|nr:RNA polymerase sigma factor [Reichenbachiella versicolor]